jgi:predicted nucleotidyltransferase
MGLDDLVLHEIVTRVLGVAQPDRIILFGSAARGTMTRDSDVDLLVLERRVADARGESVRIRRALRGLRLAFDVVVMETARFEATKEYVGTLARPAHLEGKVLHAA